MDDAIEATIRIMDANPSTITIRSSYHLAAMRFTPADIATEIKKTILSFNIYYHSDFRQQSAESWPKSIDDNCARKDWGWKNNFDLEKTSEIMLHNLQTKYA